MLKQVYLFDGLSEQALETIEQHTVVKRYRKNTVIIEKGDDANALYILRQGQVKVYVADENNKELTLSQQGPGTILGELALLADISRTASVMTLEDCEFLVLTKHSFMGCVEKHPNIALNLIQTLAKKVQSLTESVTDFALLDVYGRIAKTLGDSARVKKGAPSPRSSHTSRSPTGWEPPGKWSARFSKTSKWVAISASRENVTCFSAHCPPNGESDSNGKCEYFTFF